MNAVLREDLEMITGEDIRWDKLKGKSVLITGAGGMIGSYMLQTLALLNDQHDYGIRILAMLRNPDKLPDEVRNRKDVEVLVHDVTEKLHIEEAVDYVIHAASPASPLIMQNQPVETAAANTLGTFYTLMLAKEKNAEGYLYISSREIYGQPGEGQDFFVPGEDFVFYDSKEDLLRKIDYYLCHEEERRAIARSGHDKIAAGHTYRHRVREMLDI